MKTFLIRSSLLLLLLVGSATARAEDGNYLVNEDFSKMPENWPSSYNDWTLYGGTSLKHLSNLSLNIQNMSKNNKKVSGYAITPALGYAGNVLLKFSYGTISNKTSNIFVIIENGGTFDDGTTSKPFCIENYIGKQWLTTSYKLINVNASTKIKFIQKEEKNNTFVNFYLDDVKVIKLGEITLDEGYNPSEAIAANATDGDVAATVNVTTGNRVLRDDIWNTMCLPFDVTSTMMSAAVGGGASVQLRVYDGYDATTKTMHFGEPAGTVSAGTPFLVRVGAQVDRLTFNGVTLSQSASQTVTYGPYSFVGTYGPVTLNRENHLFLNKSNELVRPTEGGTSMKGLRAFFAVAGGSARSSGARLLIAGDDATAIGALRGVAAGESRHEEQDGGAVVYTLDGRRAGNGARGIVVTDGKLIVKP